MPTSSQLPLPLPARCSFSRSDLVIAAANERAVAFIDAWPDWPARSAALFGPSGCGKTHLTSIWREKSDARLLPAATISENEVLTGRAFVIEDVDSAPASPARDAVLFSALESGSAILFTGRSPPATWTCVLPDLASRLESLTALELGAPDEGLLAALARKLFSDRQIFVPDTVIDAMLRRLHRSPSAVRDFVEKLDAAALASARPVTLALVRDLIGADGARLP